MAKLHALQSRNVKRIEASFDLLKAIHRPSPVIIHRPGHDMDKAIARLERGELKGFNLIFENHGRWTDGLGVVSGVLSLQTSRERLDVEEAFLHRRSPPTAEMSISSFRVGEFDKTQAAFFRLVIPVAKKPDFSRYIESFEYRTKTVVSVECARIQYDGAAAMDAYIHTDRETGSHYLILDTPAPITYEEFSERCFTTLVAIGYVTGRMYGEEGYCFMYPDAEMAEPVGVNYRELRGALNAHYTPVHSNPHAYIRDTKLARELIKVLRPLSLKEFSALASWVYGSFELRAVLLLIIEACTSSLLLMPAGLAVALESMRDVIGQGKGKKKSVAPIRNKTLAKKIRTELNTVLDRYATDLTEEARMVLKKRIEQLNEAPNSAKLTQPFDVMGIRLTDEDKRVINHRNDFLHGRITLAPEQDEQAANKEIYYVALRFYTLLALLILKKIGYDNRVVNYPKIYSRTHGRVVDEDYYRQV